MVRCDRKQGRRNKRAQGCRERELTRSAITRENRVRERERAGVIDLASKLGLESN